MSAFVRLIAGQLRRVGPPRPDASRVGIARAGLTTGDLAVWNFATDGRTIPAGSYDGVWFKNLSAYDGATLRGGWKLDGPCTFTRCIIDGATDWPNPAAGTRYLLNPVASEDATWHTFTDCVLDGGGIHATTALSSSQIIPAGSATPSGNGCQNPFAPGMAYDLIRCHLRRFEHLLQPSDNPAGSRILVDSCLLNQPMLVQYASDVSHVDGMQTASTGVHDLEIRDSVFDLYQPGNITGAQIANTGSGGIFGGFPASPIVGAGLDGNPVAELVNIDIHHNYFNGGQYAWHLQKAAYDPSLSTWLKSARNSRIRNNRFGLQHEQIRDTIGTAYDGTSVTWTDNVWDAAGTTLGGATVTAGQTIP